MPYETKRFLHGHDNDDDSVISLIVDTPHYSRIYLKLEYAVSRMLHRAQKYEVDLSLFEDPANLYPADR